MPIVIRGEAWGDLYLTEKQDAAEFTAADEQTATVLAGWAGIAIDNARLFEGVQARKDELERAVQGLEATTAIVRAIGTETDVDRVLELIVTRGRALIERPLARAAAGRGRPSSWSPRARAGREPGGRLADPDRRDRRRARCSRPRARRA